mgnify:CR=1 FL=1
MRRRHTRCRPAAAAWPVIAPTHPTHPPTYPPTVAALPCTPFPPCMLASLVCSNKKCSIHFPSPFISRSPLHFSTLPFPPPACSLQPSLPLLLCLVLQLTLRSSLSGASRFFQVPADPSELYNLHSVVWVELTDGRTDGRTDGGREGRRDGRREGRREGRGTPFPGGVKRSF